MHHCITAPTHCKRRSLYCHAHDGFCWTQTLKSTQAMADAMRGATKVRVTNAEKTTAISPAHGACFVHLALPLLQHILLLAHMLHCTLVSTRHGKARFIISQSKRRCTEHALPSPEMLTVILLVGHNPDLSLEIYLNFNNKTPSGFDRPWVQ